MAAKEMWDFLSEVSPDSSETLSVAPQNVLEERGFKNQIIHIGDDGSEERIVFSDSPMFYVKLEWESISESDSGTIIDFFYDPTKGNGRARTFKWAHPSDGHTYTVRFESGLSRLIKPTIYGIASLELRVLGRAP